MGWAGQFIEPDQSGGFGGARLDQPHLGGVLTGQSVKDEQRIEAALEASLRVSVSCSSTSGTMFVSILCRCETAVLC